MPNTPRGEEPRAFARATGGAPAKASPTRKARTRRRDADDQWADNAAARDDREEDRLDKELEDSFPASDPPSAHQIT